MQQPHFGYCECHNELVRLVVERQELLNLAQASWHSRCQAPGKALRDPCQAFFGIPIIAAGRVAGVLVLRRRGSRALSEDRVSALITLTLHLTEGFPFDSFVMLLR